MARLASTVHVQSPDGEFVSFGPSDTDLPEWLAAAVPNPKAWAEAPSEPVGEAESGDGSDDGKPSGRSSLEEWRAYALAQGKTEDDLQDLKRDDIRALFA